MKYKCWLFLCVLSVSTVFTSKQQARENNKHARMDTGRRLNNQLMIHLVVNDLLKDAKIRCFLTQLSNSRFDSVSSS